MRSLNFSESVMLGLRFYPAIRSISRMPFASRDSIEGYQLSRIKKLVTFAYDNVPFYRKKYDEAGIRPGDIRTFHDFKRLPTVTKKDIIENYPHNILASGTDLNRCIISRSSGSSGAIVNVVYGTGALIEYILAGFRIYSMVMDYKPWHKQVYIYTSPYPVNGVFGAYRLYFIPTVNKVNDTIAELRRIRPDLLVCYPSHLRQLSHSISREDLKLIKPLAISVNSEMSTQGERDELAGFFGCGVYDEYSTEELTRVASQCKAKNYHIFEDINYIEILNDRGADAKDGEVGEIVGTNLHNFTMPFIRYKQSDMASVSSGACSCGRNFKLLNGLKGRKNDEFILPGGKTLSSGFLLDASYNLILEFENAIKDYCIIQESRNDIVMEIIAGDSYSEEKRVRMEDALSKIIGEGVAVKVARVEELYKTKSGKQNPIISKVSR